MDYSLDLILHLYTLSVGKEGSINLEGKLTEKHRKSYENTCNLVYHFAIAKQQNYS